MRQEFFHQLDKYEGIRYHHTNKLGGKGNDKTSVAFIREKL